MANGSFISSVADRGFRFLSDNQLKTIHYSAMRIMKETGIRIRTQEGRDLLEGAGCRVKGDIVFFPNHLVEKCIASAPSTISFYGRNNDHGVHLKGRNVYFCTGGNLLYTIDYKTGERRQTVLRDVKDVAILYDYLPNLDMSYSMATVTDVPENFREVMQFSTMLRNTNKPLCNATYDIEQIKIMTEISIAVRGSLEELQQYPLFFCTTPATAPLQQPKQSIDRILYLSEMKIPVACNGGVIGGGTGPYTMAGSLATATAESLSGLVLSQVKNPGAPVLFGNLVYPQDMRTSATCFSSPEAIIIDGAISELAKFYDIPNWGTGGCTESKIPDEQCAIESTMSVLGQMMTGTSIVHAVGYLDSSLCASFESLVMNDEIIGMAKAMLASMTIDDENLAFDVIDRVGHGGMYLTEEHTFKHCRDHWQPTLMERRNYNQWHSDGAATMRDRIKKKIDHILETHKPEPMDPQIEAKVNKIVEDYRQKIQENA